MANLYFRGERAPEEEARKKLLLFLADHWNGTFGVDFRSDDGGRLIRAIVEVENVSASLDPDFRGKLPSIWMGWRLVVIKVPIGTIDEIHS